MEQNSEINYKALLKKYIDHVRSIEGIDFLDDPSLNSWPSEVKFDQDEILTLKSISEEIQNEYNDEISAQPADGGIKLDLTDLIEIILPEPFKERFCPDCRHAMVYMNTNGYAQCPGCNLVVGPLKM